MQGFKIIPNLQLDVLPIVQSRALEVLVVQRKSQWFDQVQVGSGGHTGAPDVAGVPVDFRGNQYYMAFQLLDPGFLGVFINQCNNLNYFNSILKVDWLNS